MTKQRLKQIFGLYAQFAFWGCFTFGGGWGIIGQMQKEYVEKKKLITQTELLDTASVAKGIPGAMISNAVFMFGYRIGGLAGGLACVLGITTPPLVILSLVTIFYNEFRDNPYVAKAMTGVSAAVVPIVFSAKLRLCKGSFPRIFCYIVAVVSLLINLLFKVNCLLLIVCAAFLGIFLGKMESIKEDRK